MKRVSMTWSAEAILRRLRRWKRLLISGGLLSVSLFSVDLFNIPQRLAADPSGLVIEEWDATLPICAISREVKLSATPTWTANLFEWHLGNHNLLASAREEVENSLPISGGRFSEIWHLLSFSDDGYRVDFRFGQIRPAEIRRVGAGRDCNQEHLRSYSDRLESSTCSEMELQLRRRIRQITETMQPDLYWHSYEYRADYESLTIDIEVTNCDLE